MSPQPRRPTPASLHRRRLMLEVGKAYYLRGRNRLEIAAELGLSRFQVTRLLDRAREVGIVSITLNSGAHLPAVGAEIRRHLGLRHAEVVEVYGDEDSLRAAVGQATGAHLAACLADGEVLGLGWGRTLNAMMDGLEHLPPVEVVQLSGRFGADIRNAAADLTRRAIALTGGTAKAISAPFFTDDARAVNALRRRPEVASVVAGFDRLTTAVVSIGAVAPRPITIAYSDLPARFIQQVRDSGGVGEICGNLFADDGHVIDSSLWRHTLTITAEQLGRVPRVVAAAAHVDRAEAVHAVCTAGVATDLVLDVELAHALLRLPAVSERLRVASTRA